MYSYSALQDIGTPRTSVGTINIAHKDTRVLPSYLGSTQCWAAQTSPCLASQAEKSGRLTPAHKLPGQEGLVAFAQIKAGGSLAIWNLSWAKHKLQHRAALLPCHNSEKPSWVSSLGCIYLGIHLLILVQQVLRAPPNTLPAPWWARVWEGESTATYWELLIQTHKTQEHKEPEQTLFYEYTVKNMVQIVQA